jgi:hypothetical protein
MKIRRIDHCWRCGKQGAVQARYNEPDGKKRFCRKCNGELRYAETGKRSIPPLSAEERRLYVQVALDRLATRR